MSSEEVLSCLSSGEWVETGLVCDALGVLISAVLLNGGL